MTINPEIIILDTLTEILAKTLKKLKIKGQPIIQEVSRKSTFGDYCTPVFQIAAENQKSPTELASEIAAKIPKHQMLESVNSEGGYINYKLKRSHTSKIILSTILNEKMFYKNNLYQNKRIIVEHTSANPNGPIHIGNLRGSIIGDTYSRILKTVGATVLTNFYVDDLGHQIPVVVIGYELYKKYYKIPNDIRIDYFLGNIYGITHTIYDIQKIRKDLNEKYQIIFGKGLNWLESKDLDEIKKMLTSKRVAENEINDIIKETEFILNVQNNIYKRFKDLYDKIKYCLDLEKIDLPEMVLDINRRYMKKEKEAFKMVRKTCEDAIKGQKEELATMGITHDNFDWESDHQWSGEVDAVLQKLDDNGYLLKEGKARLFDANKAADLEGAREYLKLKENYEVPKGILVTSTGDSLYLLRDIAYSLKKTDFYNTDLVYNVIGKQQELTQRQLNLAIRAIGREDAANKIWHLNYEYMELKGALTSMSARRLQYITPGELLEKTKAAVLEIFLKDRDYSDEEKEKIAQMVAVGAIKYSIIAIGLMKKMIFDPQEVISLNNNTSPFIQYAYARSQNILAKTDFNTKIDLTCLELLKEDEEWELILSLTRFSNIILQAAEQIKPELVCTYLYDLANSFNKFYDNHRVLDAATKELITARLALTYSAGQVLNAGLSLLGIESPSKM